MCRSLPLVLSLAVLLGACTPRPTRPLLLLVTVDTLRADHIGAYGARLGLTPRLDGLAAESTTFTAAYAPTSFTLPSLAALMTSRYPEEVGVDGNSTALAAKATTLAEWLGARGWRTGAVVSNYVLRRSSSFDAGFDVYDATFPQYEAVRRAPERIAPDTTAAALRALDDMRDKDRHPLFLWVHYQDPHGPYVPPEALRARFLPHESTAPDARRALPVANTQSGDGAIPMYQYLEGHHDPAYYRAGYDGEVATVDGAVGALLDGVAQRGLLHHAVVVFTADHGEGLGESDYWFAHGERLTDPLVRIPLFVRVPGRPPARRDEAVSLLDVVPTLAALLGHTAPPGARGRDLLQAGAAQQPSTIYLSTLGVSAIPRRGLVARGYKYLLAEGPGARREQLFPLGDERSDVSSEQEAVLRAMRAELAATRQALRPAASSRQVLSPEEIEKLRSLGYVEHR